jgi:hypothetical protein
VEAVAAVVHAHAGDVEARRQPAWPVRLLEHHDRAAAAGEGERGHETGGAGPEDDDVRRRHGTGSASTA